MERVLAAAGATPADVVKVTVYLLDIDDRPLINPVRQEFFGATRPASTLVEVSRLAVPGARAGDRGRSRTCTGDRDRDRGARRRRRAERRGGRGRRAGAHRRAARAQRGHHACARRRRWPARAPACSGALAGVPVLVKDLIDTAGVRTTYALVDLRRPRPASAARRRCRRSRRRARSSWARPTLDEFAWGVCGQNTLLRRHRQPGRARPRGRRLEQRQRGGAGGRAWCRWRWAPTPAARSGIPAAACGVVGLKTGARRGPDRGRLPAGGELRHRRPDGAHGGRLRAGPRRAHRRPRSRRRAIAGLRVGVLTAHPDLGAARGAGRARRARAGPRRAAARARRRRARALAAGARERHVGGLLRRDRRGARGHLPEPARRVRPADPRQARPRAHRDAPSRPTRAARALAAWRARAAREPDVDLVLAPTLGYDELPPVGVDELGVRLPFSAYARAFSYLGWPAIAIGALQLAGRDAGDRHRRRAGAGARGRGALASGHARDRLHPRERPRLRPRGVDALLRRRLRHAARRRPRLRASRSCGSRSATSSCTSSSATRPAPEFHHIGLDVDDFEAAYTRRAASAGSSTATRGRPTCACSTTAPCRCTCATPPATSSRSTGPTRARSIARSSRPSSSIADERPQSDEALRATPLSGAPARRHSTVVAPSTDSR